MEDIDIYILLENFTYEQINFFKKKYLNNMVSTVDYYEFPQFKGETEFETENEKEMLSFLLEKKGRPYKFYYRSIEPQNIVKLGMIFINIDCSLILGISIPENKEELLKNKLKSDFQMDCILSIYGVLPPENSKDFKVLSTIYNQNI